ncbi:MAG TPA: hypothetical protein VGO69_09450, partial [Pyrinomonadaceae bacterium]|nr:hypothetical protein [Pyrinomonadaceae bacterium]
MNTLALLATLIQETAPSDGSGAMPVVITIVAIIITLLCLALYIASIVWVYRDAERHGKSGILVALLVALISWPIGLVVWLIVRK